MNLTLRKQPNRYLRRFLQLTEPNHTPWQLLLSLPSSCSPLAPEANGSVRDFQACQLITSHNIVIIIILVYNSNNNSKNNSKNSTGMSAASEDKPGNSRVRRWQSWDATRGTTSPRGIPSSGRYGANSGTGVGACAALLQVYNKCVAAHIFSALPPVILLRMPLPKATDEECHMCS